MLWGDNWTLFDWIRQNTDYNTDTETATISSRGRKQSEILTTVER